MSQPTVGRIIKKICKNIALLLPQFIIFPSNTELGNVKSKFYQLARFPTVIGAIDCTHVRIKCPAKNVGREMAGHYLNRKGFYSLNVQVSLRLFLPRFNTNIINEYNVRLLKFFTIDRMRCRLQDN